MELITIYFSVALVLTLFYMVSQMGYLYGWLQVKEYSAIVPGRPIPISVIVPVRNEENNIEALMQSLQNQTYETENFEILVIDDFSTDNTAAILQKYLTPRIRLIRMSEAGELNKTGGKKAAITMGIENAANELIVTTDADCLHHHEWLQTIASFYRQFKPGMIVMPVVMNEGKSFVEKFQSLEFCGLAAISAATLQFNFPTMCNGANLAFSRELFYEVKGYEGNISVASGDDMFLMHKIYRAAPQSVKYLKNRNCIVQTSAISGLKNLLKQRIRWTSKTAHYQDNRITAVLLLSYLFHLSLLTTFAWTILTLFSWTATLLFGFQLLMKLLFEYTLLAEATAYFRKEKLLYIFVPAALLYIPYVIYVGATGIFSKSTWKERIVN